MSYCIILYCIVYSARQSKCPTVSKNRKIRAKVDSMIYDELSIDSTIQRTDLTNIDALSTKLTFNPNPPLLPECRFLSRVEGNISRLEGRGSRVKKCFFVVYIKVISYNRLRLTRCFLYGKQEIRLMKLFCTN